MTATPTVRKGAAAGDRPDAAAGPNPHPGTDCGWLERCRPHIDALWILASISTVDQPTAERAVIEAVTAAFDDLAALVAGPAWVWGVLVRRLDAATAASQSPGDAEDRATATQRQTVALIKAGRKPSEVADFLAVPLAQVHCDLRTGLRSLRHELIDCAPGKAGKQSVT